MTKSFGASVRSKSDGAKAKTSVPERRVRDTVGRVKTLRVLDIGSRTFGDDLQYVFGKSVATARRDNKWILGTPDVAPKR